MMPICLFLVLLSEICQVQTVEKTPAITQSSGVITAKVGGNVTLECFCRNDAVTFLSWYQQRLGGKPLIISTRMKHNKKATISPAYIERFQVQSGESINHLTILNLRPVDSATYYCGILEFNAIEFGQGAFLNVKTSLSNIHAVVRQPLLELLRPGESVNLSCTVYAEKCAGEQSVYWFRHGAAQPAVMYRNVEQCMTDSHIENCTLNLVIKSVNASDAGMYYCALASCGEIVFGNGTRVEVAGDSAKVRPILAYCLSGALAVSIILLLVLAFTLYKLKTQICSVCKGSISHLTCSAASEPMSQDADLLHYAALSLNRTSERHRQEESVDSVCVYSRVRSRKE
ncbi:uncharacterized protein [Pagrus major]|uniref:uncharacterized protein n=1 Tax=Pagrus major TaxID=143350 RepID=UPI003CC88118